MSVWIWAILLLLIGIAEFFIDQYQKISLARLKFWPSVGFQTANQYFTLLVNVYAFGTVADFWAKVRAGVYDFKALIPYTAYIHGCIIGTAIAILVYKARKKRADRERRQKLLEKARLKKKQLKTVKEDVSISVTEESIFADELEGEELKEELKERIVERVVDRISKGVDHALTSKEPENDGESTEEIHDQDRSERESPETKGPDTPSA